MGDLEQLFILSIILGFCGVITSFYLGLNHEIR